ncbi:IucA/IucC family protein [Aneurinibacillus thermoaerophilus]|uniref:IucA/IucC family siderophore biosynthesis protein n=1 Tax=Aneurinibacillus thermoaerophilus TaxID=143495 RepID=A0ABX8YAL5_ANETH|nr:MULTISPECIES: IucA/IucC family protein [Aneurinibacillus]AMA71826.1 siderophore biosynthesis protein [Aneurinibacillus sp. XH2]MED0677253.1 IucA/IucC family protein [Aneurinibacillus thermoaerophilus]QYY42410.1 IucA/IucC family siderophore biosynthesis protein [Aneurinibacillus thermoaerophilus]
MIETKNETFDVDVLLEEQALVVQEALSSPQYVNVRRRIFRQLVESLFFEGIIQPEVVEDTKEQIYYLRGISQTGEPTVYLCRGKQHSTFGRIRLSNQPILRQAHGEEREAESITQFLLEVSGQIGADETRLANFIHELEQTLLKDTLAQYYRSQAQVMLRERSYDELEGNIMDGHPYHPSYKSRIGFNYVDNYMYGPEFQKPFRPLWLAVRRGKARFSIAKHLQYKRFLDDELGEEQVYAFTEKVKATGNDPREYLFLPVHPWQWKTIIVSVFLEDIRRNDILLLGCSKEEYIPQQSIRTLANCTSRQKAYLKLSLSIINTSTSRVLAPHTVENAPVISDWLKHIVKNDPFLQDELRLVLLGEVMGISYDPVPLADYLQEKTYGVLSCIWRESLQNFMDSDEEAIPFNALCSVDLDNRPFISSWIDRYGAEQWLTRLLTTSILPIIHFLYVHGIALESHAQNMVLLHKQGMPTRVVLKDFHDGIRFSRTHVVDAKTCPALLHPPEYHARVNRNSFIETDDPETVRDFVHDAFFFINIGELALFMEEYFAFNETKFWLLVRGIIETYQRRFLEHKERFSLFNFFAPTIGVEQLTKRRLFPDTELRIQQARNPLYRKDVD